MGWILAALILVPSSIAGVIAFFATRYSVKGGLRRLVGVILCPVFGGLASLWGWWVAYVGFPEDAYMVTYPVIGWIGIIMGIVCIVFGTLLSAFGSQGLFKKIVDYFEENSGSK